MPMITIHHINHHIPLFVKTTTKISNVYIFISLYTHINVQQTQTHTAFQHCISKDYSSIYNNFNNYSTAELKSMLHTTVPADPFPPAYNTPCRPYIMPLLPSTPPPLPTNDQWINFDRMFDANNFFFDTTSISLPTSPTLTIDPQHSPFMPSIEDLETHVSDDSVQNDVKSSKIKCGDIILTNDDLKPVGVISTAVRAAAVIHKSDKTVKRTKVGRKKIDRSEYLNINGK